MSIFPAAYPDPTLVTVIPVIVGAVVPVTSTVALALFTAPCVKITLVYWAVPAFVGLVPAWNSDNKSSTAVNNFPLEVDTTISAFAPVPVPVTVARSLSL